MREQEKIKSRIPMIVLSALFLLFAMFFVSLTLSKPVAVRAATKQQIKEKVKKLEKEVKELEKKKKEAVEKDDKLKKGYQFIYGDLLSTNPFIVKCGIFTGNGYYWVNDSSNMSNLLAYAGGYVKTTGKYKTWNGITCAECKAYKISDEYLEKANECDKKIQDNNKLIFWYNAALDATISSYGSTTKYKLSKGDKLTLSCYMSETKYNKVLWSSSNESVATVSKKGVVKAVGSGEATITAQASVSGGKVKFKISVYKDLKSVSVTDVVYIDYSVYKDSVYNIEYKVDPVDADVFIQASSINGSRATKVAQKNGDAPYLALTIKRQGRDKIDICDSKGKIINSVEVIVYKPLKKVSFEKKEYTVDENNKVNINLDLSPWGSLEPVELEYDSNQLKVQKYDGYGYDYEVELLTGEQATITAKAKSGVTGSCIILSSTKDDENY